MKLLEPGGRFGDYIVEKLLGKGGMGAVYLLRAVAGGARYAVKIMIPPEGEEAEREFRKRFAREAYFAMKIRHRNLIAVYDVGEDPETGLCYILMDYVPGGNLTGLLHKRGRLGIGEAVELTLQIASALNLAHEFGVVHRDLKPDNIMFDADGVPKLSDLGIAKFADDSSTATSVTSTGIVMGTPAYMAPEQMVDSHQVDARADIYSLGMVFYEMLTGVRPHGNSSMLELVAKAVKGIELPNVRTLRPEVPPELAKVVASMCSNRPEKRPPTALAAAQLCMLAMETWRRRQAKLDFLRRMRYRIMAGVGALALAVAAIIGFVQFRSGQAPAEATLPAPENTVAEAPVVQPEPVPAPPPVEADPSVPAKPVEPAVSSAPQYEPGTRDLKLDRMPEHLRELVQRANRLKGGSFGMWDKGCLAFGRLKLEGYSSGCREVASWAIVDERTGDFAIAVHPGKGKAVFLKHGYAPLEVEVPESGREWRDDRAVDLGTLELGRIRAQASAMVSFRAVFAPGAGKARLELTLVNDRPSSSVGRWDGKHQTPRVCAVSRTVENGQQVSVGNCVRARYILTLKTANGRTYRRELDFSREKYLNLGDVKL